MISESFDHVFRLSCDCCGNFLKNETEWQCATFDSASDAREDAEHKRWVFANNRAYCPKCADLHGFKSTSNINFTITEDAYMNVVACGNEEILDKIRELLDHNQLSTAKDVVHTAIYYFHELILSDNETIREIKDKLYSVMEEQNEIRN